MSSIANVSIRALGSRKAPKDRADRPDGERYSDVCVEQSHYNTLDWIENVIRPNAFVSVILPVKQGARDHQFYLSLWTREAERALWGPSTLRIGNYADRCLWLFVHQTITKRDPHSDKRIKFHHYHGLLRMPRFSFKFHGHSRPMLMEAERGRMLAIPDRCSMMQGALVAASTKTPQPYADSQIDHLRGADIDVRPYQSGHATYAFREAIRQLRADSFREQFKNGPEQPSSTLLDNGDVLILPHLPHKKEKKRCRKQIAQPTETISTSGFGAVNSMWTLLKRQPLLTSEACLGGFVRRSEKLP